MHVVLIDNMERSPRSPHVESRHFTMLHKVAYDGLVDKNSDRLQSEWISSFCRNDAWKSRRWWQKHFTRSSILPYDMWHVSNPFAGFPSSMNFCFTPVFSTRFFKACNSGVFECYTILEMSIPSRKNRHFRPIHDELFTTFRKRLLPWSAWEK